VILVDSSVWIDHFRKPSQRLDRLLDAEQVCTHPLVIGEVACGNLKNRREIIALMHALPTLQKVEDDEILFFIDRHHLNGKGVGLIDIHLLASCLVEKSRLSAPLNQASLIADVRIKEI
jgi:predicted nucleic acid-binding protein